MYPPYIDDLFTRLQNLPPSCIFDGVEGCSRYVSHSQPHGIYTYTLHDTCTMKMSAGSLLPTRYARRQANPLPYTRPDSGIHAERVAPKSQAPSRLALIF